MKKYPFLKKALGEIYDFTQCGIFPKSILGKLLKAIYLRDSIPEVLKIRGSDYLPQPTRFLKISKEFVNLVLSSGYQGGACQDGQKLERTFAASGIQYRTPFVDKNLIETAFSISDELKFKNQTNKFILRKALESIVPAEFLSVPKVPQSMQYDLNFSIVLDEICDEYLSKDQINSRGFFNYSSIKKLRKRRIDKAYSPEGAMRLWTALLTELWAIKFLVD
jgi:asparagine synthetase B (glutamine-hydrolysing)